MLSKEKIDRINELSKKAKEGFSAMGLLEDAVLLRKDHSTIYNIKGDDAMFEHLTDNKIICSQRGGGIRFSFHYYNALEDIDFIVRIIKEKL